MTFQILIGTFAALWVASVVACALAFRWSRRSAPRRFWAAVVLSAAAVFIGYYGLTHFKFAASKTVNGHTQWSINSKWFFIATLILATLTLAYTVWKQWRAQCLTNSTF